MLDLLLFFRQALKLFLAFLFVLVLAGLGGGLLVLLLALLEVFEGSLGFAEFLDEAGEFLFAAVLEVIDEFLELLAGLFLAVASGAHLVFADLAGVFAHAGGGALLAALLDGFAEGACGHRVGFLELLGHLVHLGFELLEVAGDLFLAVGQVAQVSAFLGVELVGGLAGEVGAGGEVGGGLHGLFLLAEQLLGVVDDAGVGLELLEAFEHAVQLVGDGLLVLGGLGQGLLGLAGGGWADRDWVRSVGRGRSRLSANLVSAQRSPFPGRNPFAELCLRRSERPCCSARPRHWVRFADRDWVRFAAGLLLTRIGFVLLTSLLLTRIGFVLSGGGIGFVWLGGGVEGFIGFGEGLFGGVEVLALEAVDAGLHGLHLGFEVGVIDFELVEVGQEAVDFFGQAVGLAVDAVGHLALDGGGVIEVVALRWRELATFFEGAAGLVDGPFGLVLHFGEADEEVADFALLGVELAVDLVVGDDAEVEFAALADVWAFAGRRGRGRRRRR